MPVATRVGRIPTGAGAQQQLWEPWHILSGSLHPKLPPRAGTSPVAPQPVPSDSTVPLRVLVWGWVHIWSCWPEVGPDLWGQSIGSSALSSVPVSWAEPLTCLHCRERLLPTVQGEAWEMPWAPGAGQSPAVAFVVHPVTRGVRAWACLSTQAAIAGGSFLPVLQESRNCPGARQGETGLAAFLGEGDSCLLHFPGSGGQATPLRPSLLLHGASWSLTPDWAFLPLHLGLEHLGLCLHPQPKS